MTMVTSRQKRSVLKDGELKVAKNYRLVKFSYLNFF